jgi:hypothetical protein
MPTRETAEYPKPKDAYEFEDIVWDIFKRKWNDPQAQRYGSSGQKQQGVDVYGQPQEYVGGTVGVQCKRYDKLDRKVIYEEITKAEEFRPPLAHYIIATTMSRDSDLQVAIRLINQERKYQNKFTVEIQFWEDLTKELAKDENQDLLRKHFPNWCWQTSEIEPEPGASSQPVQGGGNVVKIGNISNVSNSEINIAGRDIIKKGHH